MKTVGAYFLAAALLGLFVLVAQFSTALSSTQHVGGQSLIVGNALRASDLADVGTISGHLRVNPQGLWSLQTDHALSVISAPGGSVLSDTNMLTLGEREFAVGERVDVEGGYSPTGVIFFWKITPQD